MVEINIEEGMPSVDQALKNLIFQLSLVDTKKDKIVVIIHGYGSGGKGGAICAMVRKWLDSQLRKGAVKCVIEGENFNMYNEDARKINSLDKGVGAYYGSCNHGATIVKIK